MITLFVAGDVMTGRGIDQILNHPGDPQLYESFVHSATEYVRLAEERNGPIPRDVDDSYIWGDAIDVLDSSAVGAKIINLETAVTDHDEPWPGKGINYRMHPANVGTITSAGIDCCVLANNHVLDWSYDGLEETIDTLGRASLRPVGTGTNEDSAWRPVVIEKAAQPRVIVVALGTASSGIPRSWAAKSDRPGVAFAPNLGVGQVERVTSLIDSVAKPGDLVVVSIHWGGNWGYGIPGAHRSFSRNLIDRAGVHLVHGHSSHHPLGIEVYRDRPILYGCGDLINDYEGIAGHEEYRPDLGFLYLVTMDATDGRLQRLELVPLRMKRFRLELASREEKAWLHETQTRLGEALGTCLETTPEGHLMVGW